MSNELELLKAYVKEKISTAKIIDVSQADEIRITFTECGYLFNKKKGLFILIDND